MLFVICILHILLHVFVDGSRVEVLSASDSTGGSGNIERKMVGEDHLLSHELANSSQVPPGYDCPYDPPANIPYAWYFREEYGRKGDQQSSRAVRDLGENLVEDLNRCCKEAFLEKDTSCDRYTCQDGNIRQKQFFFASSKACAKYDAETNPGGVSFYRSNNHHPVNRFSQDCPKLPPCRESVPKTGTMKLTANGRDLGEWAMFESSGILAKIEYEVDVSLPWVLPETRSEVCKFSLFDPATESWQNLGKITSGENLIGQRVMGSVPKVIGRTHGWDSWKVKSGNLLFWHGCDIAASNKKKYEDRVDQVTDDARVEEGVIGAGLPSRCDSMGKCYFPKSRINDWNGLSFPSLKVEIDSPDFRPKVNASYNNYHRHLLLEYTAFGDAVEDITEYWNAEKKRWQSIEVEAHENPNGGVFRLVLVLKESTDYRVGLIATHSALKAEHIAARTTHIYLSTSTPGCPSNEKCCTDEMDTGTRWQCVPKKLFGRTCGAEAGRTGARDASGKPSQAECGYCALGSRGEFCDEPVVV